MTAPRLGVFIFGTGPLDLGLYRGRCRSCLQAQKIHSVECGIEGMQ